MSLTSPAVEPEPAVLNVPEIAALLRVPRSAVYAMVARNRIPHARVGKHLRFHRAEVVRALFAVGGPTSVPSGAGPCETVVRGHGRARRKGSSDACTT